MIVVASASAHTRDVMRNRITKTRLGLTAGGPRRGSGEGTVREYFSGNPIVTALRGEKGGRRG